MTPMRIMVVMPAPKGIMAPEAEERVVKTILSYASESVEMSAGFPTEFTGRVPRGGGGGAFGTARNHIAVAERMVQAEQEGVDACIPYGMNDYGEDLARTRAGPRLRTAPRMLRGFSAPCPTGLSGRYPREG